MTNELQISSLGESFPDLAKRLDDALFSFIDGPPFRLQRLCEILLDERNIYSKLSKLALALEKNLLVTSTLTISADPSVTMLKAAEADTEAEGSQHPSNSVPNGIAPTGQDPDKIMGEVEATEVVDGMTIDMETLEKMVRSETNSTIAKPSGDS